MRVLSARGGELEREFAYGLVRQLFETQRLRRADAERAASPKLAADGLSNREIAQALFVTIRTVEGHLTQTYMKLDVGSREQLAPALSAAAG